MMLAWILSPIGRWLSLVGAVFAALGIAWLRGQAAGKAACAGAAPSITRSVNTASR